MLSPEQVAHFETFGFIALRQALSPEQAEEISREFDAVLAEDRGGQAFSGEKRQAVLGFVERRPVLTSLVESDLIYEAMEQLLGPGFVWVGSDGNLYVGDTGWHPDARRIGYGRIKVAFYLDPVSRDTGCLRVIPGSHQAPLHEALKGLQTANPNDVTPFGVPGGQAPAYPIESQPGDVVIFNQNLWHAAYGGKTGRRMFTLNFAGQPVLPEHEDNLRKTYEANLEFTRTMQYTATGRVYDEAFLHSDRPRLRAITEKLVEMGFH